MAITRLRRSIKAVLKSKAELHAYVQKEYVDPKGTAEIEVVIKTLGAALSPFCGQSQSMLGPELVAFIDAKAYPVPLRYPLRLRFLGALSQAERQRLLAAFKAHYSLLLLDRKQDIRQLSYRILRLAALGTSILAASLALQFAGVMFTELLSILGSFALWEAADALLLERHARKLSYYAAGQIAAAQVEFAQQDPQ